jgi:hypothetical protein
LIVFSSLVSMVYWLLLCTIKPLENVVIPVSPSLKAGADVVPCQILADASLRFAG